MYFNRTGSLDQHLPQEMKEGINAQTSASHRRVAWIVYAINSY